MQADFDLFISYSNKDKPIADAVLSGLEANGIRCWIAPRNLQKGKTWGGSIVRSIRATDVFLLILTANSNQSGQVLNEVTQAVNLQKSVICYWAETIALSDDLAYFLSSTQGLIAYNRPLGEVLPELVDSIRSLLPRNLTVQQPTEATGDKPVLPKPYERQPGAKPKRTSSGLNGLIAGILLAFLIIWFITKMPDREPTNKKPSPVNTAPSRLVTAPKVKTDKTSNSNTAEKPKRNGEKLAEKKRKITPANSRIGKYEEASGNKPYDKVELDADERGWRRAKSNGRWGYVNEADEWVIQPEYEAISPYKNNTAAAFLNGQLLTIDRAGKKINN